MSSLLKKITIALAIATVGFTIGYKALHLTVLLTLAITAGTTLYHFVMRLVVGYFLPRITNYDFDYTHPWFRPRHWEAAFYKKLKLHRWKGRLPTYAPDQFSLEENSLHRIIQNMCGAELVHEIIMLCSFLPVLMSPIFGEPGVFWITSVCAALFDSLFVMAQRYNRPRVLRLLAKRRPDNE